MYKVNQEQIILIIIKYEKPKKIKVKKASLIFVLIKDRSIEKIIKNDNNNCKKLFITPIIAVM